MSTPEFVSTAEAADMLGVSAATISRKAVAGELEVVAKGRGSSGARFFRRTDVEQLATARRAEIEAQLATLKAGA